MFIKYLLNLKHVNLDQLNWSLELHDNLITPLYPTHNKSTSLDLGRETCVRVWFRVHNYDVGVMAWFLLFNGCCAADLSLSSLLI
jgi:hypothetical protein